SQAAPLVAQRASLGAGGESRGSLFRDVHLRGEAVFTLLLSRPASRRFPARSLYASILITTVLGRQRYESRRTSDVSRGELVGRARRRGARMESAEVEFGRGWAAARGYRPGRPLRRLVRTRRPFTGSPSARPRRLRNGARLM